MTVGDTILIRNVTLPSGVGADLVIDAQGNLTDFCAVAGPDRTVEAAGKLVAPRFAEPHAHLDRAFSQDLTGPNQTGTLTEAVDRFLAATDHMTINTLLPGAIRALTGMRDAGVAHVRTHTVIGAGVGFRAWDAVEQAAESVEGVTVDQVPTPTDPDFRNPEVAAWMREAADRGAVAVGGAPWLIDEAQAVTRSAVEMAAELEIGIDLHVDETDDPNMNTVEAFAEAVKTQDLGGRAVAAHCCSLAATSVDLAKSRAALLAESGISVVVCPISNLALQGRASGLRGIAPVELLRREGVTVGIGADNIRDVVVGVGTADPLRVAWVLAMAGHLWDEKSLGWLGSVVFETNRSICGLSQGLQVGDPADLLLFDCTSAAEAVALVPSRRRVGHGFE